MGARRAAGLVWEVAMSESHAVHAAMTARQGRPQG
jgi:hypothetical protein